MAENISKEVETEAIAEKVVNSVLDSDRESSPTRSRRSSNRLSRVFADGLTFLKEIQNLEKSSSPVNDIVTKDNQSWQIWYWKRSGKQRNSNWQQFLQKKSTFNTKEQFWSVIDEINGQNIELLSDHFDCFVFKEGIKPMWEDPDNKEGGRWIIQINREHCWKHLVNLEEIWLKVVILITGYGEEVPDHFDQICGCVLMVRHDLIKIAIWTKDANNALANLSICRFLKKYAGFNGIMWYERHSTCAATRKANIKFNSRN